MLLFSFLFWLTFYALGTYLERTRIRQGRWPAPNGARSAIGLAASLLYAVIVILVGLPILALDFNVGQSNNAMQNSILSFVLPWFIVDSLWLIYERFWKKDLFIQHIVAITGLTWVLVTGRNGWEMTAAASFGELLPLFYIGILAKRWNFGSERFFFINDTVYIISFITTRFFVYSILAYLVVAADDTHWVLVASALGLLLISYYWGVALIRKYLDKWGSRL